MSARRFFRKLAGRKILDLCDLSTPEIHRAVLDAIEMARPQLSGDWFDIGSGGGQLLRSIAARYSLTPYACDYTDALMETPTQKVEVVDLNRGRLNDENSLAVRHMDLRDFVPGPTFIVIITKTVVT